MNTKVCASILSADFLRLGDELKRCEHAGCDYIHVDVMDGNYVQNIAVGLCVAKWLPKGSNLRLDAHLAVKHPQDFVEAFAKAGMHAYLFHPETYMHHFRLIQSIRKNNMLVGLALSPSYSIENVRHLLEEVDIIDQLAVDAGFPHQSYNNVINEKVRELKRLKEEYGYHYEIQVDGGINECTAQVAAQAGAEVLISGSALFESNCMKDVVKKWKNEY